MLLRSSRLIIINACVLAFISGLLGVFLASNAQAKSNSLASSLGHCGDHTGATTGLYRTLSEVQGSGQQSPLKGKMVVVEGIVTHALQKGYKGFWLQQNQSHGLFIYHTKNQVKAGQTVRLRGLVAEYQNLTEIKNVSALRICKKANPADIPKPVALTLPLNSMQQLEQLEGMLVKLTQPLIVSDLFGAGYGLGNYGQFAVSSKLHYQPTELHTADYVVAHNLQAEKAKDYLLVDDGDSKPFPRFIPFPNSAGFSASNAIRIGDRLNTQPDDALVGVLHAYKQHYILIPTLDLKRHSLPIKAASWAKKPFVDARSNLVVASMNLGNYFNGKFPSSRGAKTYKGFVMQRQKIVAALSAINADVIAVMELENDGHQADSAIADLTAALNRSISNNESHRHEKKPYQYIIPKQSPLGRSTISVGILYRSATVKPVGDVRVLNAKTANFNDKLNRPSLIQTFSINDKAITIAVNHFKSKGRPCRQTGTLSQREKIQGHCNQVRTQAAKALAQFLKTKVNNQQPILIVGDLNSYSQEDPLLALYQAGYTNVKQPRQFSYSYQGYLGNLDHALVNSALLPKVRSVDAWHINSVEDVLLDYNTKANGHTHPSQDHYGEPNEKRSSDHDPIIIGLEL